MTVSAVFVMGVAGMVAGALARKLVRRLARGARVRAPVCEVGVGALWAVIGDLAGAALLPPAWLGALLGMAWLGVAVGVVDVRQHRMPDALTLPAAGIAPVALLPLGAPALGRGLLGSVVAVIGYGAVHLSRPAAFGAGDVKLAASLGAVLGGASWGALALAAGLAALLTAVIAVVATASGRLSRGGVVPHGPSMLAAAWLVTLLAAVGAPP